MVFKWFSDTCYRPVKTFFFTRFRNRIVLMAESDKLNFSERIKIASKVGLFFLRDLYSRLMISFLRAISSMSPIEWNFLNKGFSITSSISTVCWVFSSTINISNSKSTWKNLQWKIIAGSFYLHCTLECINIRGEEIIRM